MRVWGLVLVATIILAGGCGGDDDDDDASNVVTATGVAPPTITRSGAGPQLTDQFDLTAGLATVRFTYNGPTDRETAFLVRLTAVGATATVADVADEHNAGEGEAVVHVPTAGAYALDVQQADGPWEISIEQPPAGDVFSAPISVQGDQPSVLRWIELDAGTYVFEASYTGTRTMNVTVWSEDGTYQERASDPLTSVTAGAKTRVEIPAAGRYLVAVAVEIGSTWSLDIR